jgi:hypothetical protein
MAYRFPIARKFLALAGRARRNWLERHQNAFNFWIHLVGIPVAMASVPLLFVDWRWGVAALVLGYFLQWIGHRVEGNDVGEFIPVKKLLGLPYVAIAPARSSSTRG